METLIDALKIRWSINVRGRASVEVAKKALEERGYTVVEEEVKLTINNLQVGEVDIIAKGKEGNNTLSR